MRNLITINDVHQQFADYFEQPDLKPFLYLLSKKLSEGHICLDLTQLQAEQEQLPEYYSFRDNGPAVLAHQPLIGTAETLNKPFILHRDKLYMQRYYLYETALLQYIRSLIVAEEPLRTERAAALLQQRQLVKQLFPPATDLTPDDDPVDWQLAAAITGILNNFTIITGGPGTGKTTTVAKILAILYAIDPEQKVALAAPTGKAAARMAESLRNAAIPKDPLIAAKFRELAPSTIHRLLKPVKGTPYFRHNSENPLNYDVIIVDECSMIDLALFTKLLAAIRPHTRIILLGDKDQLASVEAGSLFGDLCQAQETLNYFSAPRAALINQFAAPAQQITAIATSTHPLFEHVVELRRSRRFSGHTGIGKFSKALIQNNTAVIRDMMAPGADEQVVIDTTYSEQLFEQFITGYASYIQEKDTLTALRKMNELRVLVAIRDGSQGLPAINRRIEKYLSDKKYIHLTSAFYENRPLMLTRNYYEHGLFNGDTGIIRPDENGVLMAWFEDTDGQLISVFPGYLTLAETAFAMTIHKSQGSEFGKVLVVLPTTEVPLLTRELVYTAVSRARNKVYVQGSAETLLTAAQKFVNRGSGVNTRIATEIGNN
ncbi:DNA helicase/exodeoxyribonuclease V, alpha subunit [Chitinophaga jiangningensis]|uniref:RecBCD enzyme subunit RecD n=1 Tax=Chitinophaga jiangningensis TaxID=1419482 RepID=A0A1M7K914_9BACT|nr:exodeoxyribonuclease V subunit alpha [Chitinophaga jiangningensis]SHM61789.1 DNA helicase/exodeoxyribonuclease V, alpha subunit [Chitinophaga jiangningensis]